MSQHSEARRREVEEMLRRNQEALNASDRAREERRRLHVEMGDAIGRARRALARIRERSS
jgi:hypothetical protein